MLVRAAETVRLKRCSMNRNADVKQEIITSQRLQTTLGDEIKEPIPVIEVNSKLVKDGFAKNDSQTTTGNLGTTASSLGTVTQDWYLAALSFGFVKNATCDVASGTLQVTVTINGTSTVVASIPVLTLTAERADKFIIFPHPIKVDKNTTATMSGTFTAGSMIRSVTYIGWKDNVN